MRYINKPVRVTLLILVWTALIPIAFAFNQFLEIFGDNFGSERNRVACESNVLLIGEPGYDNVLAMGANEGRLTLYQDSVATPPEIVGNVTSGFLGEYVGWVGNIGGGGENDFGASFKSGSVDGVNFWYFQSSGVYSTPDRIISDFSASSFGRSISKFVDIGGIDTTPEVVISAPNDSSFGGRVDFYDLSPVNPAGVAQLTREAVINSYTPSDFGSSVVTIAALQGSSAIPDLLIAEPGFQGDQGKVWVVDGAKVVPIFTPVAVANAARTNIIGENTGDRFGQSIANVGDQDAGGREDFLVSAPDFNSNDGRVYLFSGESVNVNGVAVLCAIDNPVPGSASLFGLVVSAVGDEDKDGVSEFAISAPNANNSRGLVYLYKYNSVSRTCVNTATLTASPISDFERFGSSMAGSAKGCDFIDVNAKAPDFAVGKSGDGDNGVHSSSSVLFKGVTPTPTVTATPTSTSTPTPTTTPTSTPPQSLTPNSDFSFKISRQGEVLGRADLSNVTAASCQVELFARTALGSNANKIRRIFRRTTTGSRFNFSSKALPRSRKVNGITPALYMILRYTCGTDVFFSNTFGRYLNCGDIQSRVGAEQWLDLFQAQFAGSAKKPRNR